MSPAGPEQPAAPKGLPLAAIPVPLQAMNAAEEGPSSSGMSPSSVARALRRRWAMALVLGLLCSVGAAAVAFKLIPVRHTAQTTLRVGSNQPTVLPGLMSQADAVNYQRTQLAMVKSRLVLNAALRDPKVAQLSLVASHPNQIEWLEKELKADYKLAPEILRISMTGGRPPELRILVNAVREAYLKEVVEKERLERLQQLEELKKLYAEYEDLLRDKRRTLRELAHTAGSRDPQTLAYKHKFALERLAQAQKELMQLQSDLRKARVEAAEQEAREKAQAKGVSVPLPAAVVEAEVKKDPQVEKAAADVTRLEGVLESTRRLAARGDNEPLLKQLQGRVDAARQTLAGRIAAARPRVEKALQAKAQFELQTAAAHLRGKLSLLTGMEKALSGEVERLEKKSQEISKGSVDMESMREDLAQAEDMAKKVGSQVEALKVELRAPSRVSLLEEAVVSSADGEKRRLLATGGAAFAGLALVLAGVVWLELRARRIATLAEVKQDLGMALVGALPTLPRKPRGGRRRPADLQMFLESVDATRTVLLHKAQAESLRTVMITSAVSGEGKTSLSSHLAASLARAGCRTLLVDGDLRSPSLHKLLGLPRSPGLSEVLRGEVELEAAVQESSVEGLSVLAAGQCDEDALQGLARARGQQLFDTLKARYDFVIVDSAPVLPVADSLLIGRYVDAVLFSLLRDVSRAPAILDACERLSQLGVRMLGAVVNGVRASAYGPRYASATAETE